MLLCGSVISGAPEAGSYCTIFSPPSTACLLPLLPAQSSMIMGLNMDNDLFVLGSMAKQNDLI